MPTTDSKLEQTGYAVPDTIGKRIKMVRTSLKLSQVQFLTPLRISQSYYSEIESGKTSASGLFLAMVCCYYGVNQKWIDSGKGEMFVPEEERKQGVLINLDGTVPFLDEMPSQDSIKYRTYARIPGVSAGTYMLRAEKDYGSNIKKGDILIVEPISQKRLGPGIYLLLIKGQWMLKTVVERGNKRFFSDMEAPSSLTLLYHRTYSMAMKLHCLYRCIDF